MRGSASRPWAMARPRPILKARTYLVTRRCAQREFLLRPERAINEGFKFMLGEAARRHGVLIYAAVVMSNHYHLVVRDERGVLPAFVHQLNSTTGHAFNVKRARRENFWSSRHTKPTHLVELEDIVRKVVYTLVNPVKAGLVERAHLWPGLTSYAWLDGRTLHAKRPYYYFDREGEVPERVSFTLAVPPEFDGDAAAWAELIQRRVAEEEARITAARRARGRGFRGCKAVLSDPIHRRGTEEEELRERQPLVAARRRRVMKAAKAALKRFYESYAAAVATLREGARSALFPAGTYMLAHRYNVSVAPS